MNKWSRFWVFLLCLILCIPCLSGAEDLRGYTNDGGYVYVTLGRYPQTVDGGKVGDANDAWRWKAHVIKDASELELTDDPILWRVLTADDEKVWLLSEYILFACPMQSDYLAYKKAKGDFTQTDLWAALNGDFLTHAFTPEESAMLLPREDIGTVFILSSKELKDKSLGFGTKASRKAWATEYAVRVTGSFVYKKAEGCCSPYWTSTPSTNATATGRAAQCTKQDGAIGYYNTSNPEEGARPSVYLKADAFTVSGGAGTKNDPWVLTPVPSGETAADE